MISPSQRPLPHNTRQSQHKHPCPGWDSNLRSQQASGSRPTPETARPLGPAIKPNRPTNFTNLFWLETLHVSDISSVYHQEFIHCTLRNGSILVLLEGCLQTCMTYTNAECTVNKLLMKDGGTVENM